MNDTINKTTNRIAEKTDNLSISEQIRSCGFEPDRLDAGAYGMIFSVRDHDGVIYAMKYIREPLYQSLGFQGLSEIDILSRVDHPHIIHSLSIITSLSCKLQDSLAIIMPLADTTLSTAIFNGVLNTEAKIDIMYKLSTALDFLHRNNILHLDIKTPNIVLREKQPYLIDFGLSMFVEDVNKGIYYPGELVTITNRPPEILAGGRQYNSAVDVWSLGMVMLSLLTGRFSLFPNNIDWTDNSAVLSRLENIVEKLPELLDTVNIKYKTRCLSLIQDMLDFNPKRRLPSSQIMEHPVFDDVRIIIVGHINDPQYDPMYSNDHRNILKIMLVWAREIFRDNSAQSLFLAIDIYNRAGTFYSQSTTTERMALAAMSLVMGMKLLDQRYLELSQYLISINQLVPEITINHLLHAETEIIYYLDGILYRSPFFDKLTTGDELILTFSHIIMDHDSTLYLRTDYDAWARMIKVIPMNSVYPTKDITIKQLLSVG